MNKVIVKKIEKLLKYQFKAIFLRRYKGTYMYTGAFILDQLRWKQIKCEGRGAKPTINLLSQYSIPILYLSLQNSWLARHGS